MPRTVAPTTVQGQTVVQPESQKGGGLWSLVQALMGLGSVLQPWLAPAAGAASVAQKAAQPSEQQQQAVLPSVAQPFNPYSSAGMPSLSPEVLQQLRNLMGPSQQQAASDPYGLLALFQALMGRR